MTRDELIAMPPGREMDALAAEHILLWQSVSGDAIPAQATDPQLGGLGHRKRVWLDGSHRMMACEECGTLPNFSTDIAKAWDIHRIASKWLFSERMRYVAELDDLVNIRAGLDSGHRLRWPHCIVFLQIADFCRAALLATLFPRPL
jgi:hypothetical protein